MTAWKRWELRVAKATGGRRTGPLGASVSDIVGTRWAISCKRTVSGVPYRRMIDQAIDYGRREGHPWLLAITRHNDRGPIAVMEFDEFLYLAAKAGEIPDSPQSPTIDEVVDSIVEAAQEPNAA